jgi:hypothetical protein
MYLVETLTGMISISIMMGKNGRIMKVMKHKVPILLNLLKIYHIMKIMDYMPRQLVSFQKPIVPIIFG